MVLVVALLVSAAVLKGNRSFEALQPVP